MATLAAQMVLDVSGILLDTSEHAVTRNVRDADGIQSAVTMIIDNHRTDLVAYDGGTKKVSRATVGVAVASGIDETYSVDVDGDGRYWAFDREAGAIEDDQCGWLWVPVTIATLEEAASMEYRRR